MAIFRGIGGAGDSTTDATITEVTQQATNAAASATSAATSATSASNSATSAETSATNAAISESNAATSEFNAASSATTASNQADQASTFAGNAANSAYNASVYRNETQTLKDQTEGLRDSTILVATAAANSADEAEAAQTAAETAETNAETAEANTLAIFGDAQDVQDAVDSATASASTATTQAGIATTKASEAASSATDAQTAQTAAETARDEAVAAQEAIDGLYLGTNTTNPTVDLNGDPVTVGDWYFNTTDNTTRIYDGSNWNTVNPDLIGDTTPQLGGDLDTNGKKLRSPTSLQIDVNTNNQAGLYGLSLPNANFISLGSDFDLRETSYFGTPYNSIDSGNDFYIGSPNVYIESGTPGGSSNKIAEFKSGAEVALYHNANKKLATTSSGVDITGNITVSGTVDGRDIAADGATLDTALQNISEDTTPQLGGDLDTNGNDIQFGDNDKAVFGTGDDLQIYHDGSQSWIDDAGTGNLNIRGGGGIFLRSPANEVMIQAVGNGAVTLYYDNSAKLATTSSGVDITGTLVSDGLTIDGSAGPLINLYRSDVNALFGAIQFKDTTNTNENARIGWAANELRLQGTDKVSLITDEKTRLFLASTGDISFYEDTGTTAKLAWDASTEELIFKDNVKAEFGDGGDLQIFHNGSNSYIREAGTGNLVINANDFKLKNSTDSEFMIDARQDGAVYIYHDGSQKLATTSTGIDVTGTVLADGLTVDGDGVFDGDTSKVTIKAFQPKLIFDDDSAVGGGSDKLILQSVVAQANGDYEFVVNNDQTSATDQPILKLYGRSDIAFYDDSGSSQDFYWDASTSRLGLGTTTPSTTLDVAGTVTADGLTSSGILRINSTGPDIRLIESDTTDLNGRFVNAGGQLLIQTMVDAESAVKTRILIDHSSGDVALSNDSGTSQDFYWDASTSRLGLGTTSPSGNLDITTNSIVSLDIQGGDGNSKNIIFRKTTDGIQQAKISAVGDDLRFTTGTTSERMRIDSSGNVGIGTTSPSSAYTGANNLVIGGGSAEAGLTIYSSTTTDGNIYFADGTAAEGAAAYRGYLEYSHNSNYFRIGVNGSEAMRIDSSGRLGIGTTSPDKALVVSGVGAEIVINDTDTTDTPLLRFRESGSTSATIFTDGGNLIFTYGSTQAARIDSSGNLLVGTTDSTLYNSTSGEGVGLIGGDHIEVATSGGSALFLNRMTSDGNIAGFFKDGGSIGNIGVDNTDNIFLSGNSSHSGLMVGTESIVPYANGNTSHATEDLGASSIRWRNLYLSGDVISDGSVTSNVSINAQTGTTYTTVLADRSKLVTLDNASAVTVTIPPNSSVAYPTGTKIDLLAKGAGQVTVAAGSGVTVNSAQSLKLRAQWSAASAIKLATDTWVLVGDLQAI